MDNLEFCFSDILFLMFVFGFGILFFIIWLDGVRCNGNEIVIDVCIYNRFGFNFCIYDKDVVIMCRCKYLN